MTDTQYRKRARELYQKDGEVEIDDDAPVSRPDDGQGRPLRRVAPEGAYVQAWVWVPSEEP